MRRTWLAVLLMLAASTTAFPQNTRANSKAEQEVLRQFNNWLDSLRRNDLVALERIIADDFMIVLQDGRTLTKEEDLAPIKSGDLKFRSLATEGVKVFVYGDTAVVTGVGAYEVSYKGQASSIRERFFDVYQKRKGRWWVIASRSTPAERPRA